ncbi:MAG: hypothetical protein RLZZ347_872 [Candidatus Parcubacteria bacterium]
MSTATLPEIVPMYPHLIHYSTPEEVARTQQMIDASEAGDRALERAMEARDAQIKPRPVVLDETDWLAKAIWDAPGAIPTRPQRQRR